jgi:protein-tyrosine kinase
VIIDSPPVLAVADATLIGARVDGVLVVLRWGEVTVSEARLVRHRLESTGSTLIGSVLSRFPNVNGSDYHPYVKEYAAAAVGSLKPLNHPV